MTADQYNVTVGLSECTVMNLTTLQIKCDPPNQQPDPIDEEYSPEGGIPQVMVRIPWLVGITMIDISTIRICLAVLYDMIKQPPTTLNVHKNEHARY